MNLTLFFNPLNMENAMAIAKIAAPIYLIMGFSVLFYAKQWQKIIEKWSKDHTTMIPLMFAHLVLGMIVLRMHNVWELNVWLIITLMGWIMLVKGIGYFLLPGCFLKKMLGVHKSTTTMYLGGTLAVLIGGILAYYACYLPCCSI